MKYNDNNTHITTATVILCLTFQQNLTELQLTDAKFKMATAHQFRIPHKNVKSYKSLPWTFDRWCTSGTWLHRRISDRINRLVSLHYNSIVTFGLHCFPTDSCRTSAKFNIINFISPK